jgi:hypothetical protein
MFNDQLLAGRRILVTGGGTGLGKAMATKFLQLGAEVHICGRRKIVCDETATELMGEYGGRVVSHGVDIRNAMAVDEMIEQIWTGGPLTDLINIAAGLTSRALTNGQLRRSTSFCLIWATVLIPGGFFLGGFATFGGDPGLGAAQPVEDDEPHAVPVLLVPQPRALVSRQPIENRNERSEFRRHDLPSAKSISRRLRGTIAYERRKEKREVSVAVPLASRKRWYSRRSTRAIGLIDSLVASGVKLSENERQLF